MCPSARPSPTCSPPGLSVETFIFLSLTFAHCVYVYFLVVFCIPSTSFFIINSLPLHYLYIPVFMCLLFLNTVWITGGGCRCITPKAFDFLLFFCVCFVWCSLQWPGKTPLLCLWPIWWRSLRRTQMDQMSTTTSRISHHRYILIWCYLHVWQEYYNIHMMFFLFIYTIDCK